MPCKMEDSGSKDKVFNVVKAPPAVVDDSGSGGKKIKSKKDKKYEFFFVGKFFGSKQSDGAIACRVESSLLAPYFGVYSPVSTCACHFIIIRFFIMLSFQVLHHTSLSSFLNCLANCRQKFES